MPGGDIFIGTPCGNAAGMQVLGTPSSADALSIPINVSDRTITAVAVASLCNLMRTGGWVFEVPLAFMFVPSCAERPGWLDAMGEFSVARVLTTVNTQ
jgi:hypothetical protein